MVIGIPLLLEERSFQTRVSNIVYYPLRGNRLWQPVAGESGLLQDLCPDTCKASEKIEASLPTWNQEWRAKFDPVSPTQAAENLALLAGLTSRGIPVFLMWPPRYPGHVIPADLGAADIIASVLELKGTHRIDSYSEASAEHFCDSLHLTRAGRAVYTQYWLDALSEALGW